MHVLEAWRALQRRYKPQSDSRDTIDLTQAMNPTQVKDIKKVIQAVEKWELQLKDMSGSAKKLTEQDHFRKAAVVHILPPSLMDHIIRTAGSFKTYPELKREIIRLVDMELYRPGDPGRTTWTSAT